MLAQASSIKAPPTAAVAAAPSNRVHFLNQSAAQAADSNSASVQGWLRLATAQFKLGKFAECTTSVRRGGALDAEPFRDLRADLAQQVSTAELPLLWAHLLP